MKKYIPAEIEPKWQKKWREDQLFSPDMDQARKPYYSLMMFPYPSAEGLHVGNMYAFTGSDIYSRFKRMQGFDVFEPIGLDGFGIHSENYALSVNKHPMELSKITEKRFYEQLQMSGNSYDWQRTVETYQPNYYKWTQWLFLQMLKRGLAYRKKASVNWCPSCLTVLSDEQVIAGLCERCNSQVERKLMEQWFLKITDYAERLLWAESGERSRTIDWPKPLREAQNNWIGKSEGMEIEFPVDVRNDVINVYTVFPETIFGVTYMVLAPEHSLVGKLTTKDRQKEVDGYIKSSKKKSELERKILKREKSGVFIGSYCINPVNHKKIPIWIADYVIGGYGTGAVMGVPGSDHRDFEFAQKYDLEIIRVIGKTASDQSKVLSAKDVLEEGFIVASGQFNGLNSPNPGRVKIMDWMEEKGFGNRKINYHLRDWLISRQRYWGPPIPIIYCDKCGIQPVPERDLPVELPYIEQFRPTGTGKSPLASVPDFYNVKCPNCGGAAKRETDVSDTFLDSSWYFLRYPSTLSAVRLSPSVLSSGSKDSPSKSRSGQVPFDPGITKKWLPVDMYIGGAEHAVLHLLYSRFVTMVLKDLGFLDFEEPFSKFRAHGLIIKEGAKMSKSKGNIVNPDDYIKEYGVDTLRTYLMFIGPFSEGGDFRDSSLHGIYRFLQRVWMLQEKVDLHLQGVPLEALEAQSLRMMHKTIKKVGEEIENIKFNTAIAALMEWLNHLSKREKVSKEEYNTFLLLLAPFAPHITEELYQQISKSADQQVRNITEKWSIHQQSFPKFDKIYLEEEEMTVVVQVNGKVRDTITIQKDMFSDEERIKKMAFQSNKIQKFLAGKKIVKTIYISGKVINFVL